MSAAIVPIKKEVTYGHTLVSLILVCDISHAVSHCIMCLIGQAGHGVLQCFAFLLPMDLNYVLV